MRCLRADVPSNNFQQGIGRPTPGNAVRAYLRLRGQGAKQAPEVEPPIDRSTLRELATIACNILARDAGATTASLSDTSGAVMHSIGLEVNSSMIVVHPERLRAAVPHETLVITGSPRGGTSIVAYILLRVGYFLGRDMSALNHEDREIGDAFKDNKRLLTIFESRNQQHQRWGFKYPKAALKLQWLASNLRNPVAIIVYRNPLAIARSILNRASKFEQTKSGLDRAPRRALDRMPTALTHKAHRYSSTSAMQWRGRKCSWPSSCRNCQSTPANLARIANPSCRKRLAVFGFAVSRMF
jgi:hypothetical protein